MNNKQIFVEKLRSAGLRPTKQRIDICEVLFNRKNTFHFTVNDLSTLLEKKLSNKISLATVYNTIHALKRKGYIKEILMSGDKNYFDTNISNHHHFFDENNNKLIDLKNSDIGNIKIKKNISGKKNKICRSTS